MSILAERLKELRISRNITQADLGKILSVGKTTISMYETGGSIPNDEIKIKIAQYFNVTIDYLLGMTNIKCNELNLSAQLAIKLFKELEKQGYTIQEEDLPKIILASKIVLAEKEVFKL